MPEKKIFDFYVEQKIDDRGKVKSKILTKEQALALGYYNGLSKELEAYDLYVDGFDTQKEAEAFVKEAKYA